MRIDLYDICGVIGGALMVWWSLALFDFSIRYDGKEEKLKRALILFMLIGSFLILILNILNIFGILL